MNITANTGKHFNSELLIAGLDGYDKAKEILDNCPQFYHEYQPLDHGHYKSGYYRDAAINRISMINLRKALLEYRRAHNIFEIGDYFVLTGRYGIDTLFSVFGIGSTGLEEKYWVYSGGSWPKHCVRHATDEEIKANRRLDQ